MWKYNVEGRGPKEQPNHAGISFDTTMINQIGGNQKINVILQIKHPHSVK